MEVVTPGVALSWSELQAWAMLNKRELRPWEVEIIKGLDRIRAEVASSDN